METEVFELKKAAMTDELPPCPACGYPPEEAIHSKGFFVGSNPMCPFCEDVFLMAYDWQKQSHAKRLSEENAILKSLLQHARSETKTLREAINKLRPLNASFENGTMSVLVTGEFNAVLFDANVFGVNPDDLEPCELPEKDEQLGALLTQQEVEDNRDMIRDFILNGRKE